MPWPKANLQIRVIQPTGVLPQGLWPMWDVSCRRVPLVLLPQMPVSGSPTSSQVSCLVPCPDLQLLSSVTSHLNSFINLELGCHESEYV